MSTSLADSRASLTLCVLPAPPEYSAVVIHALVTVAKAAARSDRVDTELLPLIIEQVGGARLVTDRACSVLREDGGMSALLEDKHLERRALLAECCGALTPFVKVKR